MASDDKTYSIVAQPREVTGKGNNQLRRQQWIPGVVYGHQVEPQSVQVRRRDFEATYLRTGNSKLVDLSVGEGGKSRKVFVHAVQRNPTNHQLTHIDFMVVNLRQEMTINVPLVFVGESPIVANNEGLLMTVLEHVSVRTLPTNVPSLIEVDISGLTEVDQALHVSDVAIPADVTLLSNPEDMIAKITAMTVVEEPEVEEAEGAEGAEAAEGAEGDTDGDTEGGDTADKSEENS